MKLAFKRKILNCTMQFLKLFLDPPPPSERETLVKAVELIIREKNLLSTLKSDCENYFFPIFLFFGFAKRKRNQKGKSCKMFPLF